MHVNSVNSFNVNNQCAFQARLKLSPDDAVTLIKGGVLSGTMGSLSGRAVTGSASTLAGSGFDTLGTAFILKSTGVNSSGIVPYYMEHAAGILAPSALEASNAHPALAGSVFSTIGNFLGIKTKIKTKNPS